VGFAVPFAKELRAFAESASLGLRPRAIRLISFLQKLERLRIEATEGLHLNPISHGADKEFAAGFARRLGSPHIPPLLTKLAIGAIR
jgi:hypothetical protein